MKLRNKKTGKIISSQELLTDEFMIDLFSKDFAYFNSKLKEIQEEWEYYEEPEEFWYINECGDVLKYKYDGGCSCPILEAKQIGNYFLSREEAEKAVEKLKAWKRLKDTITRIDRASFDDVGTATLFIRYEEEYHKKVNKDLDLLFGGEE